jgi:hypothetical protein
MLNKKTIQINPELFKISGGKSRKNREKKELTLHPNVTPNNLKNKLLKRIKEHKTSGTNQNNPSNQNKQNKPNKQSNPSNPIIKNNYTDEFYGALNYLSDLSKKQKVNEAKQRSLNTSTLKNYRSTPTNLDISLELPPELQETKAFVPQSNEVFNVNYRVTDDVPYGCLKNGKKKTYREWKQLSTPDKIDIPDIIRPPTPPKRNIETFTSLRDTSLRDTNTNTNTNIQKRNDHSINNLSREERLEHIKNKLKKIQDEDTQIKQQSLDNFKKLEKELFKPPIDFSIEELELDNLSEGTTEDTSDIKEMITNRDNNIEKAKNKKYLKKTIKRKFTLGKSDKLRRVSVLIKDRQTRKNIINSQKELKKTAITDIKKYLRQHGMIKVGSTCPPDILRKTFESAVLTGEVTNTNKEILLHNFLSSDKPE